MNVSFLQNSTKKGLQQSQRKPINKSQNFVYLGKNPNTKSQAVKEFQQDRQRKNSFHRLLNYKLEERSKKSISFQSQLSFNNIRFQKQERKTSLPKNSFSVGISPQQTSQTIYQGLPQRYKQHTPLGDFYDFHQTSRLVDVSDNRSDKPISPITYQTPLEIKRQQPQYGFIKNKEQYFNQNSYLHDNQFVKQYPQKTKQKSPAYVSKQKQKPQVKDTIQPQKPKKITIRLQKRQKKKKQSESVLKKEQQLFTTIKQTQNQLMKKQNQKTDFQQWIQIEKKKLKIIIEQKQDNKSLLSYDHLHSNIVNISKLQTPRITKFNKKNVESEFKTNSFKKNSGNLIEQTPIKSLQMLHSQQYRNKNFASSSKKETQTINGRYDFSNGATYEGEFNLDNQFQGNGVLYFPNGNVFYTGTWKKNQFHGFGILNNIQNENPPSNRKIVINYRDFNLNDNSLWTQYEGEFFQDKKHGFGTLYFINGDKFSGCFINDSIQGYGNFCQKKSSKTIMGIWNNNLFSQS